MLAKGNQPSARSFEVCQLTDPDSIAGRCPCEARAGVHITTVKD
jgi:hypothetical protein